MRLSRIKLAGFKSFVDPTSIHLPSNLLGVVGPNGCGKSNIIDAVRWVMGEISPKMLRGDSMSDVIFSGSSARKPVGTATVELVFDNSDGKIGGQYSDYAEIGVKRVVSRDGQSQYFLNNTRCRRRDITDLFLGTGLGPRSYSIIEQGMISQIVEARPEDLRVYLEEAAGISKYKERRRETENRIRHTRDNLSRLDDLREEIGKQLDRLKRQANAAERYKKYKAEHRLRVAETHVLKWQGINAELDAAKRALADKENRLEEAVAALRKLEARIESGRSDQSAAADHVNSVQKDLYDVGSEIARLEQVIAHTRELTERQKKERAELEDNRQEIMQQVALDQVQIEELRQALADSEPALEQAREVEARSGERLDQAEKALGEWQERWDGYRRNASDHGRLAEVERTRIDQLDRQLAQQGARLQALREESEAIDLGQLKQQIRERQEALAGAEKEQRGLEEKLEQARERLASHTRDGERLADELEDARSELREDGGRLASLEALQEAALAEDEASQASEWLRRHDLGDARRLARVLDVDEGWETAVETVLADFLDAVVTDRTDDLMVDLATLEDGSLALVSDTTAERGRAGTLSAVVNGPKALRQRLERVICCDDLDQALSRASNLESDQSLITRQGEWLGVGWARVARADSDGSGVLAREQEINALRERIKSGEQETARLAERMAENREQRVAANDEIEELGADLNVLHRRQAEARAQGQNLAARMEEMKSRRTKLETESAQIREQITQDEEAVKLARGRLEEAIGAMGELETQRMGLDAQKRDLGSEHEAARSEARDARQQAHELAVKVESRRAALASTEQALARLERQLAQMDERSQQIQGQIEEAADPLEKYEKELESAVARRLAVEKRMTEARTALESAEHALRELDEKRQGAERGVQGIRDELTDMRVNLKSLEVRAQGEAEQIEQGGFSRDELIEALPEDASAEAWQEKLERLDQRIRRLEPVNLAAIEEFAEQSERKQYLDAQNDDLLQALETLEAAIRKIDRKTRSRFKETFDQVNQGLQTLFPTLFGGGHAYLELTGDDLLTTGVAIMARPPGKRISNIHLLSGGEKALTAVAMVFAIFQLNPAPFCMLDEVDAPLDDANVGRFCDMVRQMSEQVQFVVVTHNKLTMEIAYQLIGVTMREPGVSRMVSVDIDEAAQLAAM